MSVWRVFFDGVCDPNPGGVMGWGCAADAGDGQIFSRSGVVAHHPGNTNNVAEYYGLGHGLKLCGDILRDHEKLKVDFSGLHITGDSQLVVNQVNESWQVKSPNLAPLHGRILQLLADFRQPWVIEWVRAEENSLADHLSRRAFEDVTGRPPKVWAKERVK